MKKILLGNEVAPTLSAVADPDSGWRNLGNLKIANVQLTVNNAWLGVSVSRCCYWNRLWYLPNIIFIGRKHHKKIQLGDELTVKVARQIG